MCPKQGYKTMTLLQEFSETTTSIVSKIKESSRQDLVFKPLSTISLRPKVLRTTLLVIWSPTPLRRATTSWRWPTSTWSTSAEIQQQERAKNMQHGRSECDNDVRCGGCQLCNLWRTALATEPYSLLQNKNAKHTAKRQSHTYIQPAENSTPGLPISAVKTWLWRN